MRRLAISIIIVVLFAASVPAPRAGAQTDRRCFPDVPGITNCIEGRLRQYWEQNGGLAVFGYPITAAGNEVNRDTGQTYLTQWFERNRFELHPENRAPYDVLLGRLGDDRLRAMGINWQQLPGDDVRVAGCLWFPQTQFNVCNQHADTGARTGFMTYWQSQGLRDPSLNAYGPSLALFGLPLTRPRMETNANGDTVLTQWFERARFEYHPNNPPAFRVLLGLLGNELRGQGPTPAAGDLPAAVQQPILDAAYAAVRATMPQARLATGLIDTVGDYAAALALPFGQRSIYVYLHRRATGWEVVEATAIPSAAILRQRGIPDELLRASDRSAVIDLALARVQDPRGQGLNAYVTRPRVVGNWARMWLVPATDLPLDPATQFYRREGGTWRFETGGTAFPEDQLREMGIPQELWPYGESVRGPQS